MGRHISYNRHTSPELLEKINPVNKELLTDFIDYLDSIDRSDATIKEYTNNLQISFVWGYRNLNNKPFFDWSKRDVQRYQSFLLNDCKLSPARVHVLKAALRSLGDYIETMLDEEYPEYKNVSSKVKNPPLSHVLEKTILSEDDNKLLLDYLTNQQQYCQACLVALAMYSGRRKAEVLRFKVDDFDEVRLICDGALYKSKVIRTKGRGKKGKRMSCFIMHDPFEPYLDKWLDYRVRNGISTEWLFYDRHDPSQPMKETTINGWYGYLSSIVGKPFYLHCLRHGFTTRLVRAGVPPMVIKSLIGWNSLEMINTYTDIEEEKLFSQYFGKNGIKII